ncbi:MAG: hypothetical protein RTU92_11130, partial [Candidatus Thorarchaeota archaeon]
MTIGKDKLFVVLIISIFLTSMVSTADPIPSVSTSMSQTHQIADEPPEFWRIKLPGDVDPLMLHAFIRIQEEGLSYGFEKRTKWKMNLGPIEFQFNLFCRLEYTLGNVELTIELEADTVLFECELDYLNNIFGMTGNVMFEVTVGGRLDGFFVYNVLSEEWTDIDVSGEIYLDVSAQSDLIEAILSTPPLVVTKPIYTTIKSMLANTGWYDLSTLAQISAGLRFSIGAAYSRHGAV